MLHPYLENFYFLVCTDHHALRWMLVLKRSTERLAHCHLRIQKFCVEKGHQPSAHHQAPNAMYGLSTKTDEKVPDPISKEVLARILRNNGKTNRAQALTLSRDSALESAEAVMIQSQDQNPYCSKTCIMVGVESSSLYIENGLLCLSSQTDGSVQKVLPPK